MHGPTTATDALAGRAELGHGLDRRLDDPGERAAPARMGGADHAGLGIGQQDRRAVGSRARQA